MRILGSGRRNTTENRWGDIVRTGLAWLGLGKTETGAGNNMHYYTRYHADHNL